MASPLTLPIAEQVRFHDFVEACDVDALVSAIARYGIRVINAQLQCKLQPAYPNTGTLAHWAVWYRHWVVLKVLIRLGADLSVRGTGSGMGGRTVQEYADWLDQRGHQYYEHAKSLQTCLQERDGPPEDPLPEFTASPEAIGHQDLLMIHRYVECNDLPRLRRAFEHLGARLGELEIPDIDPTYPIAPTLAHWAVWYGHWGICEWLESVGCFPTNSRPSGPRGYWSAGRTPMEYARELDVRSRHGWYRHGEFLQNAIAAGRALAATALAPALAPATDIPPTVPVEGEPSAQPAPLLPDDVLGMWQQLDTVNVARAAGTCGICQEQHESLFSMSCQCSHKFCSGCTTAFMSSRLETGPFPVRCPTCQTAPHAPQSLLTRSVLKGLVTANAVEDNIARRVFTQQLRTVEDEVTVDLLQRTSKPCPHCQTPISHYRGHGCHHIRPGTGCPGCHRHFCYVCLYDSGEVWRGCPNGCPSSCNDTCGCATCPDCAPGHSCDRCDGPRGICLACRA